jgi:tetratricopeptide (TPR) repeat protein
MHGVTKQLRIPFTFPQPPTRNESQWLILNAVGTLKLARADFGIFGGSAFNSWFDKARAATMGDSVEIGLEIEAWRTDAQTMRVPVIVQRLEAIRTQGIRSQRDRLTELRRTTPDSVFGRYLLGGDILTRALIAERRVLDAVLLSGTLTELFPQGVQAWMVRGAALAVSGDARQAATQYARAKEVFRPTPRDPNERWPQDDEGWYYLDQLARLLLELGYSKQAVPVARTVSELYPGIARAHTPYGVALTAAGDATGAAAAYARALAIDPNETRALELRRHSSH